MRRKKFLVFICSDHGSSESSKYHKMTSLKGMDELFWGNEFEDVYDWVERLEMVAKVRELTSKNCSRLAN